MQDLSFAFRFDPSQVPALIATFQNAADRLNAALNSLESGGRVPEPWLGDEVSQRIATHFNRIAVEDENSGVNVLRQYQSELVAVITQLRATAGAYVDTDSAATAAFTSS